MTAGQSSPSATRAAAAAWATRQPPGPGADASTIARMLGQRQWLVLTGAGMSTASGIPDYRGPDGTRRVQPMTIQEFRSGATARRRYWARSYVGWQHFDRSAPNAAHEAVTSLQHKGILGTVITQNVDGLHQAAGTDPVVELHGSLAHVICEQCQLIMKRRDLDLIMRTANPDYTVTSDEIRPDGDISLLDVDVERFTTPVCPGCASDQLRPDVVFFGDSVPAERVERCYELIMRCDGLLVLGSSLAVMSGLRFVRRAARRGVPVIIVTAGPSRGDDLAAVRSHRPVEILLPQVAVLIT